MTARQRAVAAVATAIVASLWVAWSVEIGPTVLTISDSHGIHLGDLAFAVLAAAIAWWVIRRGRTRSREGDPRTGVRY